MDAPAWLDELQLKAGPPWHAMGTRAEPAFVTGTDSEQLAEKRRLLDVARDVVVVGETASAAADEAARFVLGGRGSLVEAGLAVPDDLCVLTRDEADGRWRLRAAVVCFPSRWRPAEKVGRSVAEIHDPVPAYADELAARVDRFLDALRPGRGAWRRNWFVHDDPALHQPDPPPPRPGGGLRLADLWLRSERQSLHALPDGGGVLFTIRTQQVPLAVVRQRSSVAAAMAAAMRAWSPALVSYRGAGPWHEAAIAWLEGSTS